MNFMRNNKYRASIEDREAEERKCFFELFCIERSLVREMGLVVYELLCSRQHSFVRLLNKRKRRIAKTRRLQVLVYRPQARSPTRAGRPKIPPFLRDRRLQPRDGINEAPTHSNDLDRPERSVVKNKQNQFTSNLL